ncbi:unnamed protein product [Diatraea saccharalis]|uniref:RNA 3'-terminal phosphate cyclase n=1 Tax=Diatraea saccharalis TaxID=40085 RepID=A0A9N9WJD4_9NEOP|nr:unnamed protein product [Diatraea saccharalis]
MTEYMDIDGSVLEGGGQILRISISLSAILGVPVRVFNIRAGRSKPGLAAQHLKGIQLVADMCRAKLKGANIGSTEIHFAPGKIRGGHYIADTHTAGAISLLLQVALPCALLADGPVTLDLKGGTNADMAPQIDYMPIVFRPLLKRFNADFHLNIRRRGYFPKGGGHVTVEVSPVRGFRDVSLLERGDVTAVRGSSFVAGVLPLKMAQEMADGAKEELKHVHSNVDIRCYKEDRSIAPDNCNGIILWAETSLGHVLGADALGRRGHDPRALGGAAARPLRDVIRARACLDAHAQDQIILYMALAAGKSSVKVGDITLHTKTAMHIAELIAKIKFNVHTEDDHSVIECTGLGFINKNLPPE